MPSPPLLFSSAAFFGRPLASTFELVADAGYAGVEVMVTRDPASQDAAWMRRLADAHGLEIGAIHAPCLLVTRRIWGADPVAKIERTVEVASDAEVPLVVMHPPYRWQTPFRAWIEEVLPGLEDRTGVAVAIENMFPLRVAGRQLTFHANQDLATLDGIPNLVLDTSHAAVAGHDLVDLRRRFDGRLRHVHLSDNLGRGWDNHLPPGDGVLPLDRFIDDLAASHYGGGVALEVDLRRVAGDARRLREVMISMRDRVERKLAAA